jgi:hypothetical protein
MLLLTRSCALQVIAAVISAAVPVDGGRGWTSFGLLLFELNLIVWAGKPIILIAPSFLLALKLSEWVLS